MYFYCEQTLGKVSCWYNNFMSSQDNIIWQSTSKGCDFTIGLSSAKPVLLLKMPFILLHLIDLKLRFLSMSGLIYWFHERILPKSTYVKDLSLSVSLIWDTSFVLSCWILHANIHRRELHYLYAHQNSHLHFAAFQPILMRHSFCLLKNTSCIHLQQQPPSALPPVELFSV